MGQGRRIVLIGIDAAESMLVQGMIARGKLTTLAGLQWQGCWGELASPADLYSGAVWPTFWSGRRPAWHGIYHNKLWRPDRMCCIAPDPRVFTERPFWESFGSRGIRSCVVDVPLIPGGSGGFAGTYLGGWSTHDAEPVRSWPAPLARQLRREFGAPAMPREAFGAQSVRSLEQLCGELRRATEQLGRIGVSLLRRDDWQFFCLAFGAAHRAGHYLWDAGEARDLGEAEPERLRRTLTAEQGSATRLSTAVHGSLWLANAAAVTEVLRAAHACGVFV